ncbi:MAG: cupin domain-containing protein [Pseudomonadota bacterium]
MTADELISLLDLSPHPEGGWYRQTWVESPADGRPTGTSIYFLLADGGGSHWHRVDATEIWHFYAGAPLILSLASSNAGPAEDHVLGANLPTERPQIIVPKGHWQAARTTGDYTLVGCTVSPGFQFDGFELAPDGFDIPRSR